MNLREKTITGIVWSSLERWGNQVISFIVFLILARLLEPAAFGLVALASVFISFAQVFLDQGMGQAIVQHRDIEPEHLDTAFWVNMLTGTILMLFGILFSHFLADLFKEPLIAPVIAWLSLSFLLAGLTSTQTAILQRDLDFRTLSVRTLVARVAGGVVGVVCAFVGLGVWSLVAQTLAGGVVGVIVLWRISDWRPKFRFSKKHFSELFSYGSNVVGRRMLGVVNSRLDDFLIGFYLGVTALGYYTVAYRILRVLLDLIAGLATSVIFPVFSRLQEEPEKLCRYFYQVVQYSAVVAFPIFITLALLAPEIVPIFFGVEWNDSIPVMQVLAFAGLAIAVSDIKGSLILALGKPSWILIAQIAITCIRVVFFFIFVRSGIVAVALAFAVTTYFNIPVLIVMSHSLLKYNLRTYFQQYLPSILSALPMVTIIVILKVLLGGWSFQLGALMVYLLAGMSIYLLVLQLVNPLLMQQSYQMLRNLIASPKTEA